MIIKIILKTGANRERLDRADSARNRFKLRRYLLLALLALLPNMAAANDRDDEALYCPHALVTTPAVYDKVVIIIDDMGNNLGRGKEALALPGKLNYAVIPFTPHSKKLASAAVAAGKEVILHAPMSTQTHTPLGRGGLTPELSREEFKAELTASLEQLPQAQGVNNHMGSDLTERRPQMAWLMQELRLRDLYFVDSRTSQKSIAAKVASEFNVPHLSRHVFLDNERNNEAIDERFQEVLARAKKRGVAVAIGHPYPETITYLQEAIVKLEEQGIQLAFVSETLIAGNGVPLKTKKSTPLLEEPAPMLDASPLSAPDTIDRGIRKHDSSEQILADITLKN